MIPVALDAMGGDHAPQATVAGAVQAARNLNIPVLLVGNQHQLEAELDRHKPFPSTLDIVHAEAVIGMDESPGSALLRKRDASIVVAMNLVKEGRASSVVSAGNSGAVMGAAALRLGMLPGVERPAIAMLLPTRSGGAVLLDGGATVDSHPEHLRDFARMGSVYAECLLHVERPRVGLLNIGSEPSKGSALVKQTYALLSDLAINFVGNIEGQEIANGEIDVVVCDGFVGNALLKAIEGYGEFFWGIVKQRFSGGWHNRLAGWLVRNELRTVAQRLDYASYGGALLVGVHGICVISHGRSTPTAVESAIRVAKELADQGVVAELLSSLMQEDSERLQTAVPENPDLQSERQD